MGISSNLLDANTAGLEGTIGTWVAGGNTTVARVTTQAYTGTGSLRLTSTAAGAMSATTGKVAVSPDAMYMGFGFGANVAAAAGRVLSLRIDWYTAADALISSSPGASWNLSNNTAYNGNPVIVVGTAPVTAAKAALTVLVTAGITAGAQAIVWDSLGLGPPASTLGNVLPYTVESVEMDASGWSAGANCAVARSGFAAEGAYCLGVTSVAAGSMTATTAARAQVVAGTEYEVSCRLSAPLAGRSFTFEARWYDAMSAGMLLATSTRTVSTQDPSQWERWALVATAPVGATHVEMRLLPTTLGAAEIWRFDLLVIRPTSVALIAGNLLSYAAQSIEVDASDWTAGANTTISQSLPADPAVVGRSLKIVATAVGETRAEAATLVPVTEGLYYVAEYAWRTAVVGVAWTDIDWYASDGTTYLGRGFPDQDAVQSGSVWHGNRVGRQAPVGAAWARVVLLPQATAPAQVFYADSITLTQADPPYIVTTHQDTASATLRINEQPYPGTITISRVHPDGTRQPVRAMGGDAVALPTTGTIGIYEDYEAPLGVPIHYEYTATFGTTGTYDVIVPPPDDPAMLWLKDPGQPARNICVLARSTSAWSRKVDRGVYPVRGARMPVVVSDTRQSREGSVAVYTRTPDEEAALDWLLDTGSVLLLQGLNLGSVYVSVGDSDDAPVDEDGSDLWRVWTLPIIEVARPLGGMAGTAGRTWQTVFDDYDTWQDVFDAYETWLGVLTGVEGT